MLVIYIVELKEYDLDQRERMKTEAKEAIKPFIGKTVVGFGVGIPSLSDNETKYARYMLNKIAIQQMFEGEVDDWDSEEDDD